MRGKRRTRPRRRAAGKGARRSSPDGQSPESWEELARMLRVVAHPIRLQILFALSEKSQCVKDLNALVPLVQAHLSQHMTALRKAGLVASHTDGRLRCYYIVRPTLVRQLVSLLRRDHPVRFRDRRSVQREARSVT